MKIDKDIPIPAPARGYTRWPFAKMQVGDSFETSPSERATYVRNAAHNYGRAHNMKFAVRKYKTGSYRVWRTA